MNSLTIGQVAREAGVNIETVRYYERRGLITRPSKPESGYRQYSRDTVARIEFIKRAQQLGFSLREISELISLRVDPTTTCGDVKMSAEAKIIDIEDKIKTLEEMKRALGKLITLCKEDSPTSECPIIVALENVKEEHDGNR